MDLLTAQVGKRYCIHKICTEDAALERFLLSLGCGAGEPITVISRQTGGCIVAIGDSRYHMENRLAKAVVVS